MPDIRMMAVTGEPIFMLMGSSSAMVAAGPSPGRTPTAVPRTQPMRPQRRLTGVSGDLEPVPEAREVEHRCRVILVRSHRLEEQPARKRGLQQSIEDQVDDQARGEARGGRHDHALVLHQEQPAGDEDHDARDRADVVEDDDVDRRDDDGEERTEPRLGLPEGDLLVLGPEVRGDEADGEHREDHPEAEGHEAGAGLAVVEEAQHPDGLLDDEPRDRQQEHARIPLPRLHGNPPPRQAFCPISKLASFSSARTIAEWSQALPPWAAQALNSSCAVAVLGRLTPILRAEPSARFRSFWCSSMRKPGSKVRFTMRSPCTSRMRDEANPPISAWRTFAGSAPAFDANSSASPTASMVSATMIWLATLQVWPSPLPPTSVMFLPISSKSGFTFVEGRLGPAHHDGERGRLGAHLAAGDRRVEVLAAQRVDAPGELLRLDGRDRAHVHDDLARGEPLGHAARREEHLLHVRRVRDHDDDDVGRLRDFRAARADLRAPLGERLGIGADRVHEERVARLLQVARHGRAHDSQTDEADLAHEVLLEVADAQRTMQGRLLSNFQPGMRYCMATASSRAPSPWDL